MQKFIARAASDQTFQLAEGPVWDGDAHRVLWVDIPAGDVHIGELHEDTVMMSATHHVDDTVGAVATATDGGLLVAGRQHVFHLDRAGTVVEVARLVSADEERRLNDGKCDPAGRFLVGTLALGEHVRERLYQLDEQRGAAVIDDDLQMSNGLAWSPDGHTMYSVDTTPGIVWQRPYDPASGHWGTKRELLRITDGSPDGICVDRDGNLWIAVWGPGEVRQYSASGELRALVSVAAPYTSCVTFAGPRLDRLLITTAIDDLSPAQRAEHPQSGKLFIADDVGVQGLATTPWRPIKVN